eukprot:gene38239-57110_t
MARERIGYKISITGYRLRIPDVEFSDDCTILAETLRNLVRASLAASEAELPRLIVVESFAIKEQDEEPRPQSSDAQSESEDEL